MTPEQIQVCNQFATLLGFSCGTTFFIFLVKAIFLR